MGTPGKRVYPYGYRGFESHPLRQPSLASVPTGLSRYPRRGARVVALRARLGMGTPGKRVYPYGYRGFWRTPARLGESHPLRQALLIKSTRLHGGGVLPTPGGIFPLPTPKLSEARAAAAARPCLAPPV